MGKRIKINQMIGCDILKKRLNTKINMQLKKMFTKEQLLFIKKFQQLLAYNLSYPMVIRAYKRYVKNIDDYILMNGYPLYWFRKDKRTFAYAVKLYIEAKKADYTYKVGTRGYVQMEIVKVSGLDKYI